MWSGTDYMHKTNGLLVSTELTVTSSSEWSSNGDRSIKVCSNYTGYTHVVLVNLACEIGMVNGSIDILNNSQTNVYLRLIEMETGQYNDVFISPNESMQHISISRQLTSSQTIRLSLIVRTPTTIYLDNVSLTNK